MDEPDLARRFGGIDRLYGEGTLSRLAGAHVAVVGIGGVGSWAAEALARSGVGRLTLIDLDHVAESNLNRQIHALEATLGQAKVLAMAARIAQINPQCDIATVEEFVTTDNLAAIIPSNAAVIDAIDQVRAKVALIAHCRRMGQLLVTTGGAGGRRDPTRIEIADLSRTEQDVLASKVRASLRKDHGFPRDVKRKFGVDCVFSREPVARPTGGATPSEITRPDSALDSLVPKPGATHASRNPGSRPASAEFCAVPVDGRAGLACAGYGSSVMVTASFGFAAVARLIDLLLAGDKA